MENSIKFSRQLIKGKIAEIIFEQMIRDEGRYSVVPFGYEHTVPTLAQYQHMVEIKKVMENIKDAPDFALVSENKKEVFLVEVKYQSKFNIDYVKTYARDLLKRWNPSWLFVACPEGFYCDPCHTIVNNACISQFSKHWVAIDRQKAYLKLLKEFDR